MPTMTTIGSASECAGIVDEIESDAAFQARRFCPVSEKANSGMTLSKLSSRFASQRLC